MKNTECYLGREVALDTKILPVRRGIIAGPVSRSPITGGVNPHPAFGEVVIVEFDGGLLQKVKLKTLITKERGDQIHQELTAAANKLAEEYEATKELVTKKLAAAAILLREAGDLASERNENLSRHYREATLAFEDAMGDAGWSTSSWHC
jgi:hypothetical protein